MKLVMISDTHGKHRDVKLPEGDVLIHAGDITMNGSQSVLQDFNLWLGENKPKFKHIVVIAGNHDLSFGFGRSPDYAKMLLSNAIYLQDEAVVLDNVKFYGSPWTPTFGRGWAFNAEPDKLVALYKDVPTDTDVLITHGPPYGIHDVSIYGNTHCGSPELVDLIHRIQPKVNVFGHIHESAGYFALQGVHYCNASVLNASYAVVNAPIEVEI